jgi:hypothetical protein
LQLDELIAAVRSPIGTAAEHQQESVGSHQVIQRSDLTVLVRERELWNLLTNGGTGSVAVVLRLDEFEPVVERDVRTAGSEPPNHSVEDCGFGRRIHFYFPF